MKLCMNDFVLCLPCLISCWFVMMILSNVVTLVLKNALTVFHLLQRNFDKSKQKKTTLHPALRTSISTHHLNPFASFPARNKTNRLIQSETLISSSSFSHAQTHMSHPHPHLNPSPTQNQNPHVKNSRQHTPSFSRSSNHNLHS